MNPMQGAIALSLVAGAAAGALTASAAVFLLSPAPTSERSPLIAPSGPAEELAGQMSELRDSIRSLTNRLDDIEGRAMMAESTREVPADVAQRADEDFTARVKEVVGGMRADSPGDGAPPLYVEVKAAMDYVEAERAREADEKRQQAMNERMEQRLTELTAKLALAPDQVQTARTTATNFYRKTTEYFQQARESGDFQNVRETMRQYRDDAETALKATFSTLQLQEYDEADISIFSFGRDFGGPPGADFRGGGGGR
jgi:hypothetical protein